VIRVPRLVVAGTHSGAGKTTVATGLLAALTARGRTAAGAKVGPDFIDPSYHALATGRPGRNLDPFLCGEDLIAPLFAHGARGADLAVVEGVMGLFDGRSGSGGMASTAHVARLLDAPVVLVVDARGMADSVAALVAGYRDHDRRVRLAGVVLNRVGSDRHEQVLRAALAPLGLPVLGALPRDDGLSTPSRHLGLVPVAERPAAAAATVAALGAAVAAAVDLDAVERLAIGAPPMTATAWEPPEQPGGGVVAVAGGPAFSFLYQEHVELLAAAGAEVAPLDPTADEALPEGTTALYLGGGFPEAHVEQLAANRPLVAAVRAHAAAGRPVVAECGGLLYLCRSLDGRALAGVLPADATMTERLTLGYREAVAAADGPWAAGTAVRAHEFHHARVTPGAGTRSAWHLDGRREGFAAGAVHASFLHPHWAATPQAAARLAGVAA